MKVTFPPKAAWVLDVEVYRNYFLVGFKNVETGKVLSVEIEGAGSQLNSEDAEWLRDFLRSKRTVGFNSKPFDLPIIYAAIEGHPVSTLKAIANEIIDEGTRPWLLEEAYGFKVPRFLDHIDLIEVAPGKASLKIYNGRLHGRRMQDLPIPPDALLSKQDVEIVYDYWKNDLDATILLFTSLSEQLALRTSMSEEYGIDLRSKSDAQVAESVIREQVAQIIGSTPQRPDIRPGTHYRYKTPAFIRFRHPDLRAILRDIESASFQVGPSGKIIIPKALSDADILLGDGIYRLGIGGLHSSEQKQAIVADADHVLIDRDVTSYYPAIIINLGLYPKHLGWAFLKVYKRIVKRRIKAKSDAALIQEEIKELEAPLKGRNESGPSLVQERIDELNTILKTLTATADSLKITINGSFGKFGNIWSILCSPDLLIQTTITGQLSLLMLIEWLLEIGVRVVSANTDGIVIYCHRSLIPKMDDIVRKWEETTAFDTEATEYKAIYSRDVNNYVAVYKSPKKDPCKTKGAFAKTGFQKNPTNEICVEAAIAHIVEGKSLYRTIRECTDIRKFVTVRAVQGGAIWGVREYEVERFSEKTGRRLKSGVGYDTSSSDYLGKAIRWYYSNKVSGSIHYKTNGNKVPRSDGARPCMELPDVIPDDIDYGWYVKEARKILEGIGFYEELI